MKIVLCFFLFTSQIIYSQDTTADSCSFYIPNNYAPDGTQSKDHIREGWEIVSDCEFEDFDLKVFNRWGELIFESEAIYDRWFPDRDIADGTYFYKIDALSIDGIKVRKTGYVTIIK